MYTFERREEGLLAVHEDGRPAAHVETREVTFSDHVDGDPQKPRLALPQRVERRLPREKWKIHFTSRRPTPPELEALARELAAQEG